LLWKQSDGQSPYSSTALFSVESVPFMFAEIVESYKVIAQEKANTIVVAIIHSSLISSKRSDHSTEPIEQRKKAWPKPFRDRLVFQKRSMV
jgi:hypothetical protein